MNRDVPMWALVMFDLPVDTKKHRTDATRYRTYLLNLGFFRVQWSVYARYVVTATGWNTLCSRIDQGIPEGGHVRLIAITDTQWASSVVIEGAKRAKPEDAPTQLLIF